MLNWTVAHETPNGKYWRFEVHAIADGKWALATLSGVSLKFETSQALRNFWADFKAHLDREYPAVMAGELAMAA